MSVRVITTGIPGVVIIEPEVFGDARGYFFESWHAGKYSEAGLPAAFVQDNVSRSSRGTLRGPSPAGAIRSGQARAGA